MKRIFDEFKIMAVELSSVKESVSEAARKLGMGASRLSKWRINPRFKGCTILPKNDKISAEEQEIRESKKRLRDAELENAILKNAVAIFSKAD